MSGIVATKTYVNRIAMTAAALTAALSNAELVWHIKEALQYGTNGSKGGTHAWGVLGSSDSVAAALDTVDRLTTRTNVVSATGAHSWIVLQCLDLGAAPGNLQICIDCVSATTGNFSVVASVAAGFTGGSTSARPTATDEMVLSSASSILNAVASTGSMGVNCLKSTDGKTTRLVITKDGVLGGKWLWFFEELKNVESYWADDTVMGVVACTPTGLSNSSSSFMRLSTEHKGRATCMSADQYLVTTTSTETRVAIANAGGGWSVFPCGYLVDTGATKGRIGDFCDLWFAPDVVPNLTYFSSSLGGNFQFVNVGGVVLPWVGTTMVLP